MLASTAPLVLDAHAETINVGGESYTYDPTYDPKNMNGSSRGSGEEAVKRRAKTIVEVLLGLVGAVSVVMIIWGGISYSASVGDPSKMQLAKRIITSAIVGLVLSMLAFVILEAVTTISGGGTL
jgi:hypothetical protein